MSEIMRVHEVIYCCHKLRKHGFACVALLLFLLSSFYTVKADNLKFRNFNTSNGLHHNHVKCITQDSTGFIWFGTSNGICRYDGYSFIVFNHRNSGLQNNLIRCITQTNDSTLYIGTNDGLFIMNLKDYQINKHPGENLGNISSIVPDKKGGVWIATRGHGVFLIQDYVIRKIQSPSFASDLQIDDSLQVWISASEGLLKFDNKSSLFIETSHTENNIPAFNFDYKQNF